MIPTGFGPSGKKGHYQRALPTRHPGAAAMDPWLKWATHELYMTGTSPLDSLVKSLQRGCTSQYCLLIKQWPGSPWFLYPDWCWSTVVLSESCRQNLIESILKSQLCCWKSQLTDLKPFLIHLKTHHVFISFYLPSTPFWRSFFCLSLVAISGGQFPLLFLFVVCITSCT